jgi:hypothetical protein
MAGAKHSLEQEPAEAPWSYGIYTVTLIAGRAADRFGANLVSLSVRNALLLPIVLGLLYLLARRPSHPHRLRDAHALGIAVGAIRLPARRRRGRGAPDASAARCRAASGATRARARRCSRENA